MATIKEFVQEFKNKKVQNTPLKPNAVEDYLKDNITITPYLPFRAKRELAELIVGQCTEEVNGIKEHDAIESYMRFVVGMIETHTDLSFDKDDPVADYDLLAEAGLLMLIIDMFKADYDESNTILGMALNAELEDNNIGVQVGKFLNGVLSKFDDVGAAFKDQVKNLDLNQTLGGKFKEEDLAKLSSLLNRFEK